MRFGDADVTTLCDVVHALRSAPVNALTNESTGLHVHVGKHPRFFDVDEVVDVVRAYLAAEQAINTSLLPLTRQYNKYCRDLSAVLSAAAGLGVHVGEGRLVLAEPNYSKLGSYITDVAEHVHRWADDAARRASLLSRQLTTRTDAAALRTAVEQYAPGDWRWSGRRAGPTEDADGVCPPRGAKLWLVRSVDKDAVVWSACGGGSSYDSADSGSVDPWTGSDRWDSELECVWGTPTDVTAETFGHWLLKDGLLGRYILSSVLSNVLSIGPLAAEGQSARQAGWPAIWRDTNDD